jgi:hypothetical protein
VTDGQKQRLGAYVETSAAGEVARTTALWRDVAREVGARAAEISRMASAFEHTELEQALALCETANRKSPITDRRSLGD